MVLTEKQNKELNKACKEFFRQLKLEHDKIIEEKLKGGKKRDESIKVNLNDRTVCKR